MDEARFEHPLSTLSSSIEHPLEPGGDQVETTWRKGKGIYLKIIVVIVTVTVTA